MNNIISEQEMKNFMENFNSFKTEIHDFIHEFKETYLKDKYGVFSNEDVMKMLDISDSTLQKYRNDGTINFRQHARKIYYTKEDLDEYFNNIHINNKKK